ncbi:unnamed protein product [Cercopithifilaria johnstoni]|uniref:Uncharacterized protein n=1 Tax=Cercopithifilaria johnstoni TaxID=2874296 RepID=A0A8J2MHM9_9BILA|nr:unnamed protein product [Cercopithifilaria johnstoni]
MCDTAYVPNNYSTCQKETNFLCSLRPNLQSLENSSLVHNLFIAIQMIPYLGILHALCLLFDLVKLFTVHAHSHRIDACLHARMKPHLLSALSHETTTPYRFHSPCTSRSRKCVLNNSEYPTAGANSSGT